MFAHLSLLLTNLTLFMILTGCGSPAFLLLPLITVGEVIADMQHQLYPVEGLGKFNSSIEPNPL